MNWEYKNFYIDYMSEVLNKPVKPDWCVQVGDEIITGISNILNYFGGKGWEAVTVSPMVTQPMYETPNTRECTVLLVVLKRPKVEEQPTD
jgi:hypothetical protein